MKLEIVFRKGLDTIATVKAVKEINKNVLTLRELDLLVVTIPELLEKVTGLRVHINEVS